MKFSYLGWTDSMLRGLNVSTRLQQQLDSLIPSTFIPDDDDPGALRIYSKYFLLMRFLRMRKFC